MEALRKAVAMDGLNRVTMAQVARRAGVSRSAVTAALSQRATTVGLNPDTRAQIRKIAEELGYRPNLLSRSFIKQKSYLISMLGSEAFFLFALETIRGIEDVLEQSEYSLLAFYHGSDSVDQTKHLQKSLSRRVDGLIIVGAAECADGPNHRLLREMQQSGMPVLQIYRRTFLGVPAVLMDEEKAGFLSTRHLIERGHRHIAHVTYREYRDELLPGTHVEAKLRCDGYVRAMREAGLEATILTHHQFGENGSGLDDFMSRCSEPARRLAESRPRITGVTTFNDYTAIGLLHNLREMGVSVPGDISIIGYDNAEAGMLMRPSLTTVRPRLLDIGHIAGDAILQMLEGRAVHDVVLEPELVVRESTA
jgi:LacI family transcriptional regulator